MSACRAVHHVMPWCSTVSGHVVSCRHAMPCHVTPYEGDGALPIRPRISLVGDGPPLALRHPLSRRPLGKCVCVFVSVTVTVSATATTTGYPDANLLIRLSYQLTVHPCLFWAVGLMGVNMIEQCFALERVIIELVALAQLSYHSSSHHT